MRCSIASRSGIRFSIWSVGSAPDTRKPRVSGANGPAGSNDPNLVSTLRAWGNGMILVPNVGSALQEHAILLMDIVAIVIKPWRFGWIQGE